MGDHNYVNNCPDHSKLLLSATQLERGREKEEEEKHYETERTHMEVRQRVKRRIRGEE